MESIAPSGMERFDKSAFEADMVTVAETSREAFGSLRDILESNYQKATTLIIYTGQLR